MNDPFMAAEQTNQASSPSANNGGDPFIAAETKSSSPSFSDKGMNDAHSNWDSIASTTMDFIDTFNERMGNFPRGVMQLVGLGDVKAAGGLSVNEQQKIAEQQLQAAQKRSPIASGFGALFGDVGSAINTYALTGGAAGLGSVGERTLGSDAPAIYKAMLTSGAENAAFTGAQATDPNDPNASHLNNAIGGAITGVAMPPMVQGAFGTLGYLNQIVSPKLAAIKDWAAKLAARGVTPEDIQEAQAPAKAIGANLSFGEMLGSSPEGKSLASLEANAGSGGDETAKIAIDHMNALKATVGGAIDKLSDGLVPEGNPEEVQPMIQAGYDAMKGYSIPPEDMDKLLNENPAIKGYIDELNNNVNLSPELRNLPDNNVYKLNSVAQDMSSDLIKKPGDATQSLVQNPLKTNLAPKEQIGLIAQKDALNDTLNNAMPNNSYNNVVDLAKRNAVRNNIMESFNNAGKGAGVLNPDGTTNTPLSSLYKDLWSTPPKREYFLNSVQKAGGDVETAKNIIATVDKVAKSPVEKILSGTPVSENTAEAVSKESILKQALGALTTNNYKDEFLKLSLGGAEEQAKVINQMAKNSLADRVIGLQGVLNSLKGADIGTKLLSSSNFTGQIGATAAQIPSIVGHLTGLTNNE